MRSSLFALGRLLASLAEPRVRERVLRELGPFATLEEARVEGSRLRLTGLGSPLGGAGHVLLREVVLKLAPRGLLKGHESAIALEAAHGSFQLHARGPFRGLSGQIHFEPSGRTGAWIDGSLTLSAGSLSVTASLEAGPLGTFARDIRLEGPGTRMTGRIAVAPDGRFTQATLEGAVAPEDLPLEDLPIELGQLRLPLRLTLVGTVASPRLSLVSESHDVPLRPRGSKRFVPHLRLRGARLEAEGDRAGLRATLSARSPDGGALTLDMVSEGRRLRGTLEASDLGTVTLAHAMKLARAPSLRLPESARAGAKLRFESPGKIGGQVTLESARSALELTVAASERQGGATLLDGTRIAGHVDAGELGETGGLHGPFALLSGRVSVDIAATGAPGAYRLDGVLTSPSVRLGSEAASFALDDARATMTFDGVTFGLDLGAELDGGSLRLRGEVTGERPAFRLSLRDARPSALATLSRLDPSMLPLVVEGEQATTPSALVLPRSLRVDLEARPDGGALEAELKLRGPETSLVLRLAIASGIHEGSRLEGTLAASDLATLISLERIAPGFSLSGLLTLDALVVGTSLKAGLVGSIRAPALVVLAPGGSFALAGLHGLFRSDPGFLAWHGLEAVLEGGRVRSSGVLVASPGRAPVFRVHGALSSVRLGALSVRGEALGRFVDGALSAVLVARRGEADAHPRAEARLTLEDAVYPLLHEASSRLRALGLAELPSLGDGPLSARLGLAEARLAVSQLRASVPGASLEGTLELDLEGALHGSASLRLGRPWLDRSVLTALPGRLAGSFEVPIVLRGSVARPEARADLGRTLLATLAKGHRREDATGKLLHSTSISLTGDDPFSGDEEAEGAFARLVVAGTEGIEALASALLAARG